MKTAIKNKLTTGSAIGGDINKVAAIILANKSFHDSNKQQKTDVISSDRWNKIACELAEKGAKNCGYAWGIAHCYGVSLEQAQAIIDEIDGAI